MKRSALWLSALLLSCFTALADGRDCSHSQIIDLAGEWKFSMDPDAVGQRDGWCRSYQYEETGTLPGLTRPLAMLMEVRTGGGSLLISGVDLITDIDHRPSTSQLRYSLEKYMSTDEFAPDVEVDPASVLKLFRNFSDCLLW